MSCLNEDLNFKLKTIPNKVMNPQKISNSINITLPSRQKNHSPVLANGLRLMIEISLCQFISS